MSVVKVGAILSLGYSPTKKVAVIEIKGSAVVVQCVNPDERQIPNHWRKYIGAVMLVPIQVLEQANTK
jgi:hypothetical protein